MFQEGTCVLCLKKSGDNLEKTKKKKRTSRALIGAGGLGCWTLKPVVSCPVPYKAHPQLVLVAAAVVL